MNFTTIQTVVHVLACSQLRVVYSTSVTAFIWLQAALSTFSWKLHCMSLCHADTSRTRDKPWCAECIVIPLYSHSFQKSRIVMLQHGTALNKAIDGALCCCGCASVFLALSAYPITSCILKWRQLTKSLFHMWTFIWTFTSSLSWFSRQKYNWL